MIVGEQCSTGSVPQDAGAGLASPYAGASPLHGVADTSTSREAVIGSLAVCRATAREQLSSFINAQASRIGESDQTNKSTCCNASRHVYGPNMIGRTVVIPWLGDRRCEVLLHRIHTSQVDGKTSKLQSGHRHCKRHNGVFLQKSENWIP